MACSGESRDRRRQHTEGIRGEENDVLRVSADARNHCIFDELEWIGRAGILGDLARIEIEQPLIGIDGDILQHGSEADRVPDLGLVGARKVNAFGVAAAFEIKDAAFAPAMLVVADQAPAGIGGERRLTGARKPEE